MQKNHQAILEEMETENGKDVKKRDSFLFYRSFYEAIMNLPRDVQGEVYTAIMEYGLNGITTEHLKPIARSIFTLIKPILDSGRKQFENGSKGGRPRNNDNPTETQTKPTQNPTETQTKPNDNPNKDKEEDMDKDMDNVIIELSGESSLSGCDATPTSNDIPENKKINYDELVKYFNSETNGVFGMLRLPLGEKRKQSVKARIREHGKKAFAQVIKNAMESDFLKGQNASGWTATFDWLIKPTNFEKVLSGNFSKRSSDNNGGHTGRDMIGSEFTND